MKYGNIISYDELDNQVGSFIHNNKEIAREEIIGKSDEGRDIKAVHVTNKDIKTEEKEIVLVKV
jgi:hypothetical protein